jgi:hypothetical protein
MNESRRDRRKMRQQFWKMNRLSATERRKRKVRQDLLGAVLITLCLSGLTGWLGFAYYHDAHADKHHATHYLDWIGPGVER